MNIASFFARSYVDALSVALAPFPANKRPANDRRTNAPDSLPANKAALRVIATGNDDLPRAA